MIETMWVRDGLNRGVPRIQAGLVKVGRRVMKR
jgi:hypothetical protein